MSSVVMNDLLGLICKIYGPAHDKTYNMICANSEDSDQPAHPRNLIRDLAEHKCILQPLGYPKKNK